VTAIPLGRRLPGASSNLPGRLIRTDPGFRRLRDKRPAPSLFGLAPGGVCRAGPVAGPAVRSYRTVSPLPTSAEAEAGGLFSVALSLRSISACAAIAPAGRYPAPMVHGARTFLHGTLSGIAAAAVRPT